MLIVKCIRYVPRAVNAQLPCAWVPVATAVDCGRPRALLNRT
jgi:hypothetical protein